MLVDFSLTFINLSYRLRTYGYGRTFYPHPVTDVHLVKNTSLLTHNLQFFIVTIFYTEASLKIIPVPHNPAGWQQKRAKMCG